MVAFMRQRLIVKPSQTAGHAAGPNPDKTAEAVKEKASKAESEVKQHVSSGKQAVSTAADSASETPPPLKPYPKVATNGQVASSNGSKKHHSVSTGTQTEPVKPGKSKESAEAASWSQSGAAQTEWDTDDQDSKPGLLGAHLLCSSLGRRSLVNWHAAPSVGLGTLVGQGCAYDVSIKACC